MKLCLIFSLILFLIVLIKINYVGSEKKKLQQKSFDEIFGEKWEEKEEEKLEEKREIIAKFYKIKEKIKQKGRKYSTKEWSKISTKIAKKLGTNRDKIYKWIKQFGINQNKCYKSKTDEEKIEIVKKFIEMTNEFKQKRKYSKKEWHQNYAEICKKIGISIGTINRWKKQFGIRKKRLTEEEKIEKMKIYWEIKKENAKMSDNAISKIVNTSNQNILNWKKQFEEEMFMKRAGEEEEE